MRALRLAGNHLLLFVRTDTAIQVQVADVITHNSRQQSSGSAARQRDSATAPSARTIQPISVEHGPAAKTAIFDSVIIVAGGCC